MRGLLLWNTGAADHTQEAPQPLSVFFCNLHGRPQKLTKKPIIYSEKRCAEDLPKKQNIKKKNEKYESEDMKHSQPTTAQIIVTELISDMIQDTLVPENSSQDDSICSLDSSSITNRHGEPIPVELHETQQHLN